MDDSVLRNLRAAEFGDRAAVAHDDDARASFDEFFEFGRYHQDAEARFGQLVYERLNIKASSPDQPVGELSGGNQQKVLLARCLCTEPKVLILDEPTRGIDVGAKAEIQSLVNELAGSGLGVLMISSELEELVEGSSRVVVIRDGRRAAELRGAEISQDAIIRAMAEDDTGVGGDADAAE